MFSPTPTPQELLRSPLFEEPLVPIGTSHTQADLSALAAALQGYAQRSGPDDFSSLTGFLEAHHDAPWTAALLLNLGLEYYNTGYYSKTLDVWARAWELSSAATDPAGKAVADRAVGELATMYARLGRMAELEALLASLDDRVLAGPATERVAGAREGLSNMRTRPEISFRCGPLALHRIKISLDPGNPGTELIQAAASTQRGCSLPQVAELSRALGLSYQMAFRESRAPFVVPSVVHLKVDHYAALVRQEGDRYLLQDPTFGNDVWVTGAALEAESSGYFLLPPGALPAGFRAVETEEGEAVWGKGNTAGNDPQPHGPCDPHTSGGGSCKKSSSSCGDDDDCKGMAVPRVHLMLVSLNINDEPVGYAPPVGPAVRFKVRYNQREAFQPATFTYANLGPKWTFDWLSYITDNPSSPPADVRYYIMGGGTRTFTGFDGGSQSYAFQQLDQTRLTRTSPSSYEMLSRDGTRKIFSQSDGSAGTSRKIFLTQLIDPSGNAVSLTYDADLRLVGITDAIGQVTAISYEHPTDLHKITRVTDPFGRFASFDYDAQGRLARITDVIGITSELGYDTGDFVTTLTTPYGVTRFTKSENGTTRSLEILHADGARERVEYNQSTNLGIPDSDPPQSVPAGMATTNQFLCYRNTYYWDKQACAHGYGDYTKARIYHWLHTTDMASTAGILESVKAPLEGRVWYAYAGQSSSIVVGSSNRPIHEGRVLDDGATQLSAREYNAFGNLTREVDPVGRTFSYVHADNGIDLLETRQTRAGQSQLLSKKTYDDQHQPLTATDAAGQTTTYTYDSRGQLTSVTNPKREVSTYVHDASGYLISLHGPLPGAVVTQTHDSIGRLRSRTDENGYGLTLEYDDLDRVTKVIYPDGTDEQLGYTLLDRTSIRDRAGRTTSFEYDSNRQRTKLTDPLGRTTRFQWCFCGSLRHLTDPMGRTTTWRHDVQGRVKCKEYADGSQITYLYESSTSRVRQRVDEKLQVTSYSYYSDDTLRRVSYSNTSVATPSVAYTYDPSFRRVATMTDGTGTTRYGYAPITPLPSLGAGQLARIDGPVQDESMSFAYDELGRRVSTSIDGVPSTSALDAMGRVISETNALGVFTYTHDGTSPRVISQICPNGLTTTLGHADSLGGYQLQRISHELGGARISEFAYEHDGATRKITSWSQQAGMNAPQVHSPMYDAADRLVADFVSEAGSGVRTFGYGYDAGSNRLTESVDGTTRRFFYNALNQLTSIEGDAGLPATYGWDAEQRLASVESGRRTTAFAYDGLGRCVLIRTHAGGVEVSSRRLVWNGDEICEERTAGGAVSKRFFSQGVKVEAGTTPGAFYYTRDHLGSIRELTDAAGQVRARYAYDPFGRRSRTEGDLDADFGFAGMFHSAETGLDITKFRAYDPESGRWLSRDPLKSAELLQGPNLYAYVDNDPMNRIDPLGLACCNVELANVIVSGIAMASACSGLLAGPASGPLMLIALAGCAAATGALTIAIAQYEDCMKKCPKKSACNAEPSMPRDNAAGCAA